LSAKWIKNFRNKLARKLRIITLLLSEFRPFTLEQFEKSTIYFFRTKHFDFSLDTVLKPFPSNSFRYYLTHSSVFFSSFPHGTCSLSVSCPYLALGGIYLPLRAAIPNNSTLRFRNRTKMRLIGRGCHPPGRRVPTDLNKIEILISKRQTTILRF